ncbi:MAG: glycoside hydrolase family 31 protein [Bifidobacteriaceae bacterium]|jgi:alpha-glucosidase|nr:glycoside hydrolase family 31 protein [Bifidobacteriaceae bacterium]MCI1979242.1 glycoside hydrolase family 31 protein [Bifidobacteriaceae bacterium]
MCNVEEKSDHRVIDLQGTLLGPLRLSVITPEIVRVQVGPTLSQHSYAVDGECSQDVDVDIEHDEALTSITTSALRIEVDSDGFIDMYKRDGTPVLCDYRGERSPLPRMTSAEQLALMEAEGHQAQKDTATSTREVVKQLHSDEHFYGLGDKTGFLDKRGYAYDNWNTDEGNQLESTTKLYKSIPFIIGLRSNVVYGIFFDNTYASHFDLGKESSEYFYYSAKCGPIDYYLIGGETMADVVRNYTFLTGRTPLPQKWTLGYQQSRWGYINESEVMTVAKTLRKFGIPCDAIHLDIDYMKGYRVFTTDPRRFPDLKKMANELKKRGIKVVVIIDPGVKMDPDYPVFTEGEKNHFFAMSPEGKTYINRVWPGESAFPDFGRAEVRDWWAHKQKFLTDNGVSGVWNDMNEPASFDGPLPADTVFYDEDRPSTIEQMHNVYGHNMARATYEGQKEQTGKRPFVISRAAYAGTQKYSTVWTGDNRSSWEHLRMSIPQLCNLGLSGFSFVGADIGGFLDDTTGELLSRWIEAAVFSPLFRNHSCVGTRLQEPWRFGEPTLSIYRKYVRLRYSFIDYLYDLFAKEEKTGLPVMRPLVMHYEKDEEVKNLNDEFLVGENLLVAPVLTPGTDHRLVYLPADNWFDFWTGERFEGGQYVVVKAGIDSLPLFVREGTILPLRVVTDSVDVSSENKITFKVWGDSATYLHYQDDGESFAYREGAFNTYQVKMRGRHAEVSLVHRGYAPLYERVDIEAGETTVSLTFDQQVQKYVRCPQ